MLATHVIKPAISRHLKWLQTFGSARVDQFRKTWRSNREGAICEALVAAYLHSRVGHIEPIEDLSFGGPDYRCTTAGTAFYVEVTSLDTGSVERASWIPDNPNWRGGSVGSLSRIMRTAVSNKVDQCSRRRDAPSLVALGILHSWVSMGIGRATARELLISDEAYVVPVSADHPVPAEPGTFVTGLRNALFMMAGAEGVETKRQSVAGVLVFGLGRVPPPIIGVINRSAHRMFDPRLLPEIQFAETELVDGNVGLRWHNSSDTEEIL